MAIAARSSEAPRAQSAGVARLRGKRILLAEDNLTNQMVATQMLEALGVQVDVANDGAEALEMLDRKSYDIFLIDIEMPRVSGLEVIREIRGRKKPFCDAPLIALTAYALREHREKIADAGADGLIPKPLIGIDQFGRDILVFVDRAASRAPEGGFGGGRGEGGGDRAPEGRVTMSVYSALEEAIGAESMVDLLGKVDADLEAAQRDVAHSVSSRDMESLRGATHVLISVAGAIGAQRLQMLAQRLNVAAHGHGKDDVAALAAEAETEIVAVRGFVGERVSGREG